LGWATSYITDLQAGRRVRCRPRGNSMTGKISSGQLCTIEPLSRDPQKGEVVLCKVRGNQYLHLVSAVRGDQFQISNNHGRVNGWTSRQNIFGILVEVQ
jgi:phage repressor protein C with HTH and peptisase S24 domain